MSSDSQPRKGKFKNYKQLMEEKKIEKIKEIEEKELNSQHSSKHKTKIYK